MYAILLLLVTIANAWIAWVLGETIGITVAGIYLIASFGLGIIGGVAIGIVGVLFGKRDGTSGAERFGRSFLSGLAWLSLVFWVLPWGAFGVLQFINNQYPSTLPRITITNGTKTVVFQTMIHIGSPEFYNEIKQDMETLAGNDYIFFYEGVRPGSEASIKELSKYIGMDIGPDMYSFFAEASGLITQKETMFTGILPATNIDLTTDEIVALAKINNVAIPGKNTNEQIFIGNLSKQYPTMNETQKFVLKTIGRGVLNFLLQIYSNPTLASNLKEEVPVMNVVIDDRDKLLSDAILKTPNQNIYVQYGALHFLGLLKNLVKEDPNWRIIGQKNITVIR